jgi:hypothetical protein
MNDGVRSMQMALATGDGTCRRTKRAVDVDDAPAATFVALR